MAPKPSPRKVEISYPPVPTRKWKPPTGPHDPTKKQVFVRKPEFPHSEKLHPSSLDKIWHRYKMITKRCAILFGTTSQNALRYSSRTRGKQGSANCFIAIGFTKMKEMQNWDDRCLLLILELGNRLYGESVHLKKTCTCTAPKDVQNSFFIHDTHMVLEIAASIDGTLYQINPATPCLLETTKAALASIGQCILEIDGKYMAIWKFQSSYYLFDPNDRDPEGKRCKDGTGVAVTIKFLDIPALVENCWDNCAPPNVNLPFSLTPVFLSKVSKKNLKAPDNLKDYLTNISTAKKKEEVTKVEPKSCLIKSNIPGLQAKPSTSETKLPDFTKRAPDLTKMSKSKAALISSSNTPSLSVLIDPEKSNDPALIPVGKPKPTPVNYLTFIVPNKLGIIRSSYQQNDPSFSKFYGKQSLANAVAACVMLRQHRSKLWFTKILDEILLMGETIYLDSRMNMVGDQVLDLKTITDKIKLNKKYYTATFEKSSIIGKLNTNKLDVLDLKPALEEFFTTNDTGLIRGPLTLAVWSEEGKYYWFDPNDRDKNGAAIPQTRRLGSYECSTECGFACLIWFKSLEDLVNLYMNNIEKSLRREYFFISKIEIKDYIEKVVPWNNFWALRRGKWIIRGHFSQNNGRFSPASRNTQCTAMATLSLIYSKLFNVQLWNRDSVDEIVVEGDNFYNKCVETLKAKNKFQDRMLMMAEIVDRYTFSEKEIILEIEDCLVNGLLRAADDFEIPNLKKGFVEFFRDNDAGVVTSRGLSVGVWKDEDAYYYFDSHSRDERGYSSYGGTACILRVSSIDDLANIMSANLGAGSEDLYNIARVDLKILDKTEEGGIKPEFNNYTELSDTKGILQATTYQGDVEKFDVLADKQTIPNIMASFGLASIYPSNIWTQDTMDEILKIGHELYARSRDDNYKKELDNMPNWEKEEEPKDLELITTENVIKEFQIGVNKIVFDFGDLTECKVEPDIIPEEEVPEENADEVEDDSEKKSSVNVPKEARGESNVKKSNTNMRKEAAASKVVNERRRMTTAQAEPNKDEETPEETPEPTLKDILKNLMEESVDETARSELIVQNNCIDVAIWKQSGLYFLFDPKGRDMEGNAIGKDTWSEKVIIKEEPPTDEPPAEGDTLAAGDAPIKSILKIPSKVTSKISPTPKPSVGETPEIPEDTESETPEKPEPIVLDFSNAKSCTMLFTSIDDVSNHIIENIPPNKRDMINIVPFKMTSSPALKVTTDPVDKSAGNWNEFQEIDNEQWIIRGTTDMYDKTYPAVNRGKQFSSLCLAGCVFARLYAVARFKNSTVDNVLKYGDRLHTVVRVEREKDMKKLDLTDEEIATVMADFTISTRDVVKKFYLGKVMVLIDVKTGVVEGDVTVRDEPKIEVESAVIVDDKSKKDLGKDKGKKKTEEKQEAPPAIAGNILSVREGIKKFFETYNFGIITAKNVSVSIWKLGDMYYMFDPDSRGPYGLKEVNGTACITRFKNTERLSNIFEKNLARHGSNYFTIDQIGIKTMDAQEPKLEVPKVTALQEITEGKLILPGHFSQDNPKFKLKQNAACCANAIVALAMSVIHKVDTWTKPIIDDIITNAYNLYRISVRDLGYDFNTWDNKLLLHLVKQEFNIGVMRVNFAYNKDKVLKGILDIKSAAILNLRRGCEEFFRENTKGVIQTEPLTVAIWTNNNLFYMFDPNPRCSTGLYTAGGTACLLVFKNTKLLTDHFIANVPKTQQCVTFSITPIEIVFYETEQIKKPAVKQADLLKVKKVDTSPSEEVVVVKKKISPNKSGAPCSATKKSPKKGPKSPCSCPVKGKVSPPKPKPIPTKEIDSKITIRDKKQWAREISQVTKLQELHVLEQKMRREFYDLGNGDAILRAHYSQNSSRFDKLSRNKQSAANAVVAIVMSKLHDLKTWTYKNIEIVLDSADVLFKDSFMTYKPQDNIIGLSHLLRLFYISHLKIKIILYKPSLQMDMEYESVYIGLMSFFMDEKAGVLSTDNLTVAVFQKSGQYFMFDPHDRDTSGLATNNGAACLLRFNFVENLVTKFFANAGADVSTKSNGKFSISPVQVESMESTRK